jgi:formamidopyrimidine-DNA glycosylase
LADGGRLYFNDQRKFGYLKIADAVEVARIKKEYGIEPLAKNFKRAALAKVIAGRKTNIKAILLNQKLLAGVGNIYADEVLFLSGIRPNRSAVSLTPKEITALAKNLPLLLKKAIKHRGTTFNNYVDAHGRQGNFVNLLKVYGRVGRPCFRCGEAIKKTRVAGRGTNFCPHCQK